MYEWINLALLLFSLIAFSVFYLFSLQPSKLSEKMGDNAWKFCRNLRIIAAFFETVATVAAVLWIWFPIPGIGWEIFNQWWIGLVLSLVIFIPGGLLMFFGIKDAGKETITPSEQTEMYNGIYNHIRHPQTIGEMPMFPAIGLAINSWFMLILMTIYIIIYMPIMLVFEERDLIRRFGDAYKSYQESTGAYFPKLRKNKKRE